MKNTKLPVEAKKVLLQLIKSINQLNFDEYTCKIELLSTSSIGEHTRHIIELFQQLLNGYDDALIDYEQRNRNITIQENIDYAIECIANIISNLGKENKNIQINSLYNNTSQIESNYNRELLYNIEHCIHHLAIIKIGLLSMGIKITDKNFGLAKSTIIYKKKCVQ